MIRRIISLFNDKRGVTLVELVVGMIVTLIVVSAAGAVLTPMMRVFARSNDLAEMNKLLDTVSGLLIADINRADRIDIDGDDIRITTNVEVIDYYIDEDILFRAPVVDDVRAEGRPVFQRDYYKRKMLGIEFSELGENIKVPFLITLTISDRFGELGRRDYAVSPLGLIFS
jgi:hypothetical protein